MVDTDTSPRDITTDHETIREWVEQRGGTPAHITGQVDDDASSLYIVREDEEMESLESVSWDDFFETFETEGLAFVHQDRNVGETDEWLYDLIDRSEVAERASLETTDVEQALLEGDVVRSEITETKVIEKTVVETDQVESQIVDSEVIESNLVDRETISREIVAVSFEGSPDLTPRLRSEPTEMTPGDTDEEFTEMTPGDSEGESSKPRHSPADEPTDETTAEPQRSPVDEPVDKTTADPPVDRPSPDREEVDRTATSEQSSQRGATGQEPGDRRATEQAGDRPASEHPDYKRARDQPTDDREMADRSPVDRERTEGPTVGLGVGEQAMIDVHDTVRTTTEVFDRQTVESRVVDQEITEADTVESDAVNIEGIEESILESDLIEGEIVRDETGETETRTTSMPSGAITSEQTEGDAIKSQFVERRLIETESTEHHQLMCDITDHTLADIIDSRSSIVERAIVDREAGEEVMLRQPEGSTRMTDEQMTAAGEGATTAEADAEMAAERSGDTGEAGMTTATDITDDEIGKQVVSGDKEVGIVSDVDAETNTLYVDPEPSMTDKIKAALDLGDTDDSYPVEADQIEEINDEEVRIREI